MLATKDNHKEEIFMASMVVCRSHTHFWYDDLLNVSAWLRLCSNPCQEVLDSVGLSGQIKPHDTAASLLVGHAVIQHAHDAHGLVNSSKRGGMPEQQNL